MKNKVKYTCLILVSLFMLASCFGQASSPKDTFEVVGGKWVVCVDTAMKNDNECSNPYTGYEFLKDGSYHEYPRTVTNLKKPIPTGKWTLNKNEFTLDQDDAPGIIEIPKTYQIIWIDKNHFYSNDKDGKAGPDRFVYFQRVP